MNYLKSVLLTVALPLPFNLAGENIAPKNSSYAEENTNKKPNIIHIVADDLGWADLGVMGSDFYETPNIDRLAKQGIMFDNAYACAANSAPSRACMMTGKYTPYHGVYTVNPPDRGDKTKRKFLAHPNNSEIGSDYYIMSEALKDAGYKCGFFGKWHLGADAPRKGSKNSKNGDNGPIGQGFDKNVGGDMMGHPYSYFYPYQTRSGSSVQYNLDKGKEGEYLTDRLTDETIDYIRDNKDKSFFIYLAHYAVHSPLQAPDSLVKKYKLKLEKMNAELENQSSRKSKKHSRNLLNNGAEHKNPTYAAMIEKLDDSVGKIMDEIDRLGLSDNTLIVFTSDNGGSEPTTDNYPLRGGKGEPYEGGIRVPLIMKWSGKISPNSKSSLPIIGVDFYPTFANLVGVDYPEDLCGQDIFSVLDNKISDRPLYWHFPAYLQSYRRKNKNSTKRDIDEGFRAKPYSIIRKGKYKLIYFYEKEEGELYNLEKDPSEKCNLLQKGNIKRRNAKKSKVLLTELNQWLKDTNAPVKFRRNKDFIPNN